MSKDIWHTADEKPPEDSYIVVKLTSGKCEVGFEFEYDFDHIENWAFFDDLLALETELDRTRKALDVAVDALKDNLSQANFMQMLDASRFHCIRTRCEFALAEITALEQKETTDGL